MRMSIERKIFEIRCLTQTLCLNKTNELTENEVKILYFVDEYKSVSPQLLISKLGIVKTNLALLTKKMIKNNLISSQKSYTNQKAIFYEITSLGKQKLNEVLSQIANMIQTSDIETENVLCDITNFLNKKI